MIWKRCDARLQDLRMAANSLEIKMGLLQIQKRRWPRVFGCFIASGCSRRLQEAAGGTRKPQEAPGSSRKPQEAPGSPRKIQEALGSPRRRQDLPRSPESQICDRGCKIEVQRPSGFPGFLTCECFLSILANKRGMASRTFVFR